MKIRCRYPVTSRDHGYIKDEDLTAALQRSPTLRPCGIHHGWVEKTWCPRCRYVVEVIMEPGDPPLKKPKRRVR